MLPVLEERLARAAYQPKKAVALALVCIESQLAASGSHLLVDPAEKRHIRPFLVAAFSYTGMHRHRVAISV